MKNIVRAFALTLVAASTIKGMEQLTSETSPKDIEKITHIKIAHIINQSNDRQSAIDTIKGEFNNDQSYEIYTKDLTKFALVAHMLANKFNTCTTNIALNFDIPIATRYDDLGTELIMATMRFCKELKNSDFNQITQLIQQGADVNFSSQLYGPSLEIAIRMQCTALIRLLLNHGAKLLPSTIGYTIGTIGWQKEANPEIKNMIHYAFINEDLETQRRILRAFAKASPETKQKFEKFIQSKI